MSDATRKGIKSWGLQKLPERFHELSGRRKADSILSLKDPAGFIQRLRPDEMYALVADIGVNDALGLIELTSDEQKLTFFDIDCWRGDTLDPGGMDQWLDTLQTIDPQFPIDMVGKLDPEMLCAYLLADTVEIFDRTQEDEINQYEAMYPQLRTRDGDFVLVQRHDLDTETQNFNRRMLEYLYRHDLEYARDLITSARSGLRLEQEELALQFRRGRLMDLGFPDPAAAHEMYARINVFELRRQLAEAEVRRPLDDDSGLALALVQSHVRGSFLSECAQRLEAPEEFVRDFAHCVNRAIVASPEGMALQDATLFAETARRVHATVSLGLEQVTDGDVALGTDFLARAWCVQLFQAGVQLAVDRAVRARALDKRLGRLIPDTARYRLEALMMRPQPMTLSPGGDPQAFRTRAELTEIDRVLADLTGTADLFENVFGFSLERFEGHDFQGLTEDDRLFIDTGVLLRTLAAHLLVGREPSFEPLPPSAVPDLLGGRHDALARIEVRVASLPEPARGPIVAAVAQLFDELPGSAEGVARLTSLLLVGR